MGEPGNERVGVGGGRGDTMPFQFTNLMWVSQIKVNIQRTNDTFPSVLLPQCVFLHLGRHTQIWGCTIDFFLNRYCNTGNCNTDITKG